MRGDSVSADKNVRRSGNLLQRDTLKVVNMADLARELSGQNTETIPSQPGANPAEFWKRRFANWRAATPLIVTVPPQQAAGRKPALHSFALGESNAEKLRSFADQVGIPFGVLFHATWGLLLHR